MLKLIPVLFFTLLLHGVAKSQCNPAFIASVNGATVQLRAVDSTPAKMHKWFLGNGIQASGAHVNYTYSLPGTYLIKHFIIDSVNNCRDSAQQYITITMPVSCSASFVVSRDSGNYAYRFTSTSTVSGGSILSYKWTLNGDSVSNAAVFDSVLQPGQYAVCLRIRTTGGCSSSVCDTISIDSSVNCNLTADFTATPSIPNTAKISFTPSPLDPAFSYFWNFGNGHFSTAPAPVYTYGSSGSYKVTLYISDSATGCHDSISRYIFVSTPPVDTCTASFSYTINPLQPRQYTFTAISNDSIIAQRWFLRPCDSLYLHDSAVYTIPNPVHTFTRTGCYQVCLTLVTKSGCRKVYCDTLNVQGDSSMLRNRTGDLISSYPNPAYTTPVTIRIDLQHAEKISLAVYNSFGNLVYRNEKGFAAGTNRISIPVEKLTRGTYYVDIRYGNNRKQSIFQKL